MGGPCPFNPAILYSICYENESENNQSWIVSGLIYTDGSLANYDICLSGYGGKRFYHGDAPGRFYGGWYGVLSVKNIEKLSNVIEVTFGTMGVMVMNGGLAQTMPHGCLSKAVGWPLTPRKMVFYQVLPSRPGWDLISKPGIKNLLYRRISRIISLAINGIAKYKFVRYKLYRL